MSGQWVRIRLKRSWRLEKNRNFVTVSTRYRIVRFIWLYKASLNGLSRFCLHNKLPETIDTLFQSALEQAPGHIFCNQNEAEGLWDLHRAYWPQLSACQSAPWHWGPSNHLQTEAGKSSDQFSDPRGKIPELTNTGMHFTALLKCKWIAFSPSEKPQTR